MRQMFQKLKIKAKGNECIPRASSLPTFLLLFAQKASQIPHGEQHCSRLLSAPCQVIAAHCRRLLEHCKHYIS